MARFNWPISKPSISQNFGGNAAYYKQYGQLGHNGIDIRGGVGTPIRASADGVIQYEGWGNSMWGGAPAGIITVIDHGDVYTGYAHQSRTIVNEGQRVQQGQVIGYVGATGAATGPHLHFEFISKPPQWNNGYAGRLNPSRFSVGVNKPKPPVSGGDTDMDTEHLTKAQWRSFISEVYYGFTKRRPRASEVDFHLGNSDPLSFVNGFSGKYEWKQLEDALKSERSKSTGLAQNLKDANSDLSEARQEITRLKKTQGSSENTGTPFGLDQATIDAIQQTSADTSFIKKLLSRVFK